MQGKEIKMSLNFEHSDIFLDTLLHSREQLKSEHPDAPPPRRRRTKSAAFDEPRIVKGFVGGEWRSKSYGQDVAKLPETLIRNRVAKCQFFYIKPNLKSQF